MVLLSDSNFLSGALAFHFSSLPIFEAFSCSTFFAVDQHIKGIEPETQAFTSIRNFDGLYRVHPPQVHFPKWCF